MSTIYLDKLIFTFHKVVSLDTYCVKTSKMMQVMCYYLYDAYRYLLLDIVNCNNIAFDEAEADLLLQEFAVNMHPEDFNILHSAFNYLIPACKYGNLNRDSTDVIHCLMSCVGIYLGCEELKYYTEDTTLMLVGMYSHGEFDYTGVCYKLE